MTGDSALGLTRGAATRRWADERRNWHVNDGTGGRRCCGRRWEKIGLGWWGRPGARLCRPWSGQSTTCGRPAPWRNVRRPTTWRGTVGCRGLPAVEQGHQPRNRTATCAERRRAPVAVNGWNCESYPTPQVLRTRDASECHTANGELLALLSLPIPSSPARRCRTGRRSRGRRPGAGRAGPDPRGRGGSMSWVIAWPGRAQSPAGADHLHLVPARGLRRIQRGVRRGQQLRQLPA